MNLNKYIENLQAIARDNPDAGEYEVIYSVDDEGNSYSGVYFGPSIGHYDKEDREWMSDEQIFDEDDDEFIDDHKMNSVCIN